MQQTTRSRLLRQLYSTKQGKNPIALGSENQYDLSSLVLVAAFGICEHNPVNSILTEVCIVRNSTPRNQQKKGKLCSEKYCFY